MQGETVERWRTLAQAALEEDPRIRIRGREQMGVPTGPRAQYRGQAYAADGRFSPDQTRNTLSRFLLALIGIVAVVAMSLGIKYYVQHQTKAQPPESTSTPTAVPSNAVTGQEKSHSAKTRRARMSATETNAPATSQAGADGMEKALLSEEFAGTVRAQAAHEEVDAAMDRDNRLGNTAKPGLPRPPCLPLPNGTKSEDVDAAYYKDWAREYSCLIP